MDRRSFMSAVAEASTVSLAGFSDPNDSDRSDESKTPGSITDLYKRRIKQDRDLWVLVTDPPDKVGNPLFAADLAKALDRTESGPVYANDAETVRRAYRDEPPGTAIATAPMTGIANEFAHILTEGRIGQKYVVHYDWNLPHRSEHDRAFYDARLAATSRSTADAYLMKWTPESGTLHVDAGEVTLDTG